MRITSFVRCKYNINPRSITKMQIASIKQSFAHESTKNTSSTIENIHMLTFFRSWQYFCCFSLHCVMLYLKIWFYCRWEEFLLQMKDISSASTAYSLVIFLVCLLLMVLYFCECGQNRGEMSSNFGSIETVVVAPTEFYKSKLLTRNEVSWPLLKSSQLKPSVAGNSRTMRENSER